MTRICRFEPGRRPGAVRQRRRRAQGWTVDIGDSPVRAPTDGRRTGRAVSPRHARPCCHWLRETLWPPSGPRPARNCSTSSAYNRLDQPRPGRKAGRVVTMHVDASKPSVFDWARPGNACRLDALEIARDPLPRRSTRVALSLARERRRGRSLRRRRPGPTDVYGHGAVGQKDWLADAASCDLPPLLERHTSANPGPRAASCS
jgi:hypothetical protein